MLTPSRQDHALGQDVRLIQGNGFFKTVLIDTPKGVVLVDAGDSISHLEKVLKQSNTQNLSQLVVLVAGCSSRAYIQAAKRCAKQMGFDAKKFRVISGGDFFSDLTSRLGPDSIDSVLSVKTCHCDDVLVSIFDVEFNLLNVSTDNKFELAIYLPGYTTLIVGSIADELSLSSAEIIRKATLYDLNRRVKSIEKLLSLGAENLLPLGTGVAVLKGVEKRLMGLYESAKYMCTRKLRSSRDVPLIDFYAHPVASNVASHVSTH